MSFRGLLATAAVVAIGAPAMAQVREDQPRTTLPSRITPRLVIPRRGDDLEARVAALERQVAALTRENDRLRRQIDNAETMQDRLSDLERRMQELEQKEAAAPGPTEARIAAIEGNLDSIRRRIDLLQADLMDTYLRLKQHTHPYLASPEGKEFKSTGGPETPYPWTH
jgi:TolA-binding protein